MARLSRIVIPDIPHRVAQRGNRRQKLLTQAGDYALYRDLLAEPCAGNNVSCWAYCLRTNAAHSPCDPQSRPSHSDADKLEGLSRAVGEAHRRCTAFVNARARVTGHLFQGRFGCVPMDEPHMLNAVRYLAFNPVRAGLCVEPGEWPWSSVCAHLNGRNDALVAVRPVLAVAPRFAELLRSRRASRLRSSALKASGLTAARSATKPSWPPRNANSGEACAGAGPDRSPGRRTGEIRDCLSCGRNNGRLSPGEGAPSQKPVDGGGLHLGGRSQLARQGRFR